jgi:hypothetical protein
MVFLVWCFGRERTCQFRPVFSYPKSTGTESAALGGRPDQTRPALALALSHNFTRQDTKGTAPAGAQGVRESGSQGQGRGGCQSGEMDVDCWEGRPRSRSELLLLSAK